MRTLWRWYRRTVTPGSPAAGWQFVLVLVMAGIVWASRFGRLAWPSTALAVRAAALSLLRGFDAP